MFQRKTVFVLGAGASHECGLPLGGTLKDLIAERVRFRFRGRELLRGDRDLLNILRRAFDPKGDAPQKLKTYLEGGNELSATLPMFVSIDEALHYWSARPEVVELGKLVISREILTAERNSTLFLKTNNEQADVNAGQSTWMMPFLMMAIGATKRENIESIFANVTLINFNYDRSVEHFLYWALQENCSVSPEAAAKALSNLEIIRPYGSLGLLPWQGGDQGVSFGHDLVNVNTFELASRIRTYTEQHQGSDIESRIDSVLADTKLVVFLGFGFHSQNMSLFKIHSRRSTGNVVATVKGINEQNHERIKQQIYNLFGPGTSMLLGWNCAQVLQDLRPTIMSVVG